MPAPGERSARMVLWLLPPHEVEFSRLLEAEPKRRAIWRKIMPGLQVATTSESLAELLTKPGDGALLQLKSGGPILQYLGSWVHEPGAPGAEPRQTLRRLRSGSLAYRWSPEEHAARQRTAFEALVRTTFSVMRKCTLPNRVLCGGRAYRKSRIGKQTFELVRDGSWLLRDKSAPLVDLELADE